MQKFFHLTSPVDPLPVRQLMQALSISYKQQAVALAHNKGQETYKRVR